MKKYNTAKKMSENWNITVRHVQYLCRMGKIEGSVKRGGSWFIPDGTPVPIKNSKSKLKGFNFIGTKDKIFNSAIKLFIKSGFNNVSVKDIAVDVGIKQSTIYHHFKSKQEILDTIYDYYCYYFIEERMPLKKMEEKLHNESIMEIFNSIRYLFKKEYAEKLSDITRLILQRLSIDERAKKIGRELLIKEGIDYVKKIFDKGVEIGRFAPFDTEVISYFLNASRMFVLINWIIDPTENNMYNLECVEQAQYKYAISLIRDLHIIG